MLKTPIGRVAVLDQTLSSFKLYDQIVEHFKSSFNAAGAPAGVSLFALVHDGDVHGLVVAEPTVLHLPDLFEAFSPWAVLWFIDRRAFTVDWVAGQRLC